MEYQSPSKAYVCRYCKGSFSQLENLQKHVQKIHTPSSSSKENRTCSLCGSSCAKYEVYRNHLLHIHGLSDEGQAIVFRSLNDFHSWKDEVEKRQCCKYVPQRSAKNLSSSKKKFYIYKCDGTASKTKEKKSTFSSTIPCPSVVAAVECTKTRDVKVEYWGTHVGHAVPPENEEIEAALSSLERNDVYSEDSRYQTISQDSDGNIVFSSESNDGYSQEVAAKERKVTHSLFQSIINNSTPRQSYNATPKRFCFKKDTSKKSGLASCSLASVACMKSKKPPPPPEPEVAIPIATAMETESAVDSVVAETMATDHDTSVHTASTSTDTTMTLSEASDQVALDVNTESTLVHESADFQEGNEVNSANLQERTSAVSLQEENNAEPVSLQELTSAESVSLQEQPSAVSVTSTNLSDSTITSPEQSIISIVPAAPISSSVLLPTVNQSTVSNSSPEQIVLVGNSLQALNVPKSSGRSLLPIKPRAILPKAQPIAKKTFSKKPAEVVAIEDDSSNEMVIDPVEAVGEELTPTPNKNATVSEKVVSSKRVDVTPGPSILRKRNSASKVSPRKKSKTSDSTDSPFPKVSTTSNKNSFVGKTIPVIPGSSLPPNARVIAKVITNDPKHIPVNQILSSLPPGRAFIPVNGNLIPVNTPTSSILTSNAGFLLPQSVLSGTRNSQSLIGLTPVTSQPSILFSNMTSPGQGTFITTPNMHSNLPAGDNGPIILLQNTANPLINTQNMIPTFSSPIMSNSIRPMMTLQQMTPGAGPQSPQISFRSSGTSLLLPSSTSSPISPSSFPSQSTPRHIVSTTISNTIQVQKVKLPFSSSSMNSIKTSTTDSISSSSILSTKKSIDLSPSMLANKKSINLRPDVLSGSDHVFCLPNIPSTKVSKVATTVPFTLARSTTSSVSKNLSLTSLPTSSVPAPISSTNVNTLPISSAPAIKMPSKSDPVKAGTMFFESGGDIYVLEPVEDTVQAKINGVVEKEKITKSVTTIDKRQNIITLDDDTKLMPLIRANRVVSSLKSVNESKKSKGKDASHEKNDPTLDHSEMDISFDYPEKDISSLVDNDSKIETKVVSPNKAGIQIKSILQQKRTHKEEDAEVLKKVKYYQMEMKYLSSQAECKRLKLELARAERKNKDMVIKQDSVPCIQENLPATRPNSPTKAGTEDSIDFDELGNDHPMDYDDDSDDDKKIKEVADSTIKNNNITDHDTENKTAASIKDKLGEAFDDLFTLSNTGDSKGIDRCTDQKRDCEGIASLEKPENVNLTKGENEVTNMNKLEEITASGLNKLTKSKDFNKLHSNIMKESDSGKQSQTINSNKVKHPVSNEESMEIEFYDENQCSQKEKPHSGETAAKIDINYLESVQSNETTRIISDDDQSKSIELCDESASCEVVVKELETQYGSEPNDIYTMVRTSVLRNLYTDLKGLCQENQKLFEELQKHRGLYKLDEETNSTEPQAVLEEQEEMSEVTQEKTSAIEQEDMSAIEQEDMSAIEQEDMSELEQEDMSELEQEDMSAVEQEDMSATEQENMSELAEKDVSELEQEDVSELEEKDMSELEEKDMSELEEKDMSELEQEDMSAIEEENMSGLEQGGFSPLRVDDISDLRQEMMSEIEQVEMPEF